MTFYRAKLIAAAIFLIPLFLIFVFKTEPIAVSASTADAAATYKAQCAMCHGPKAEKLFDLAKTDEQHVEVVLKGKKGEKPPYMPGFEAKGMKPEEAKALVEYMRGLRAPKE